MAFQKRSDFIKITGLWPSKPEAKSKYLSGQLNEAAVRLLTENAKIGGRVFIFQERDRKSDKHPTHSLHVAPPRDAQPSPGGRIAPEPDPFKEPEDFPF